MDDTEMESDTDTEDCIPENQVYIPGTDAEPDGGLECDFSAYVMYHNGRTAAPCLSFDVIKDDLGDNRNEYPLTLYLVFGTQADRAHANSVIVMKLSNLNKLKQKPQNGNSDSDSSESDDDSDEDENKLNTKPFLNATFLKHQGCVNRIRTTFLDQHPFAASWSELGKVHIWDLMNPYQATADRSSARHFRHTSKSIKPVFTFPGHLVEGYAVDWSPVMTGYLATGDCNRYIHVWKPVDGQSWNVDQRPYSAHAASVEDIQWSPNEAHVLASCSVDRSIRIWDIRAAPNKACMITVENAHESDVNVISWNRHEPLLLSGGDDGALKVWDLRQIKTGQSVAMLKHHTAPITSVEWHPTDSSSFAASGADNQLTLWDLAMEKDTDASRGDENKDLEALPPQLLFIHQGQKDIKELHWHPQISSVVISTAADGFNVFKTISI